MNDAEFLTQKRRVLAAYKKWSGPTGMHGWIDSHTWHRDGTAGGGIQYEGALARTSASWDYITVVFHWNLEGLSDKPDHVIDRIVRHEIGHALVNEMRMWSPPNLSQQQCDEAMRHEERVVSQLQSVLLWCFDAGARSVKSKPREKK